MSAAIPQYFFRLRENGAQVFHVDTENRHRRIEMEPIAVVNIRNGDVKPQGERALSDADRAAIDAWMTERRALLAAREADQVAQTIERINLTAQWAQTKATEAELEAVTEDLLMAMYDLRTILVRKKAERL